MIVINTTYEECKNLCKTFGKGYTSIYVEGEGIFKFAIVIENISVAIVTYDTAKPKDFDKDFPDAIKVSDFKVE